MFSSSSTSMTWIVALISSRKAYSSTSPKWSGSSLSMASLIPLKYFTTCAKGARLIFKNERSSFAIVEFSVYVSPLAVTMVFLICPLLL